VAKGKRGDRGDGRTRYRTGPTFVCDVRIYRSCAETRGESYSARFIGRDVRPLSLSPFPNGGAHRGRRDGRTAVVFYLIYESQAPRSSTFGVQKGRDSFICMPRNPVSDSIRLECRELPRNLRPGHRPVLSREILRYLREHSQKSSIENQR